MTRGSEVADCCGDESARRRAGGGNALVYHFTHPAPTALRIKSKSEFDYGGVGEIYESWWCRLRHNIPLSGSSPPMLYLSCLLRDFYFIHFMFCCESYIKMKTSVTFHSGHQLAGNVVNRIFDFSLSRQKKILE